jgi:hypothetical protein
MPHTAKRGDTKTLQWNLGRDLSSVTQARVIIKPTPTGTAAVDRNGTIVPPATNGIVSLALLTTDYAASKLYPRSDPFLVEVETSPGPLTHPDDPHAYERLYILQDMG